MFRRKGTKCAATKFPNTTFGHKVGKTIKMFKTIISDTDRTKHLSTNIPLWTRSSHVSAKEIGLKDVAKSKDMKRNLRKKFLWESFLGKLGKLQTR